MALGFWQIAVLVVLFLLLFGRGKIPQLMTDVAQGIKGFRQGMREDAPAADMDKTIASNEAVAASSSSLNKDNN